MLQKKFDSDIIYQKRNLRKKTSKILKEEEQKFEISPEKYNEIAKHATNNLLTSPIWKEATYIFSFNSLKSEMGSDLINEEVLLQEKKLFLPKILNETQMIFTQVFSIDYEAQKGSFGIKEPIDINKTLPLISDKILFLLPGLAFSNKGDRLGRGKGYYDKFLYNWLKKYNKNNNIFIGWCYNFQVIDSIPCETTDIKVDYICTERGLTLKIN